MPDWSHLIIAGSTILFVLTFTLTTILHETAHALVGRMFGDRPVLYHTFVEHQALAPRARAITAAAGPIFSLFQGIIFSVLCGVVESASAMIQLFVLWTAIHGLVNFFGYLITTPFARKADLGKVADYLQLNRAARFVLFGIGILAQIAIGIAVTRLFLRVAPSPEVVTTDWGRRNFIFCVTVLPWIFGAIICVLTRMFSPQLVSIIYPFVSGLFSLVTFSKASSEIDIQATPSVWDNVKVEPWIAALLFVLIVFRVFLARGIRFDKSSK